MKSKLVKNFAESELSHHDLEFKGALQAGAYTKAFQVLAEPEKDALQVLVKGGDALPIPLFSYYFGQIRPYWPWR